MQNVRLFQMVALAGHLVVTTVQAAPAIPVQATIAAQVSEQAQAAAQEAIALAAAR